MIEERIEFDETLIEKLEQFKKRSRLGRSLQMSSLVLAAISLYFAVQVYIVG